LDATKQLADIAGELLAKAHIEAKAAWDNGATEEQMKPVLKMIRDAQWRVDFAPASHGAGFHAPLETARIIGTSIKKTEEARLELQRILNILKVKTPVQFPDISTKEKAQQYLGLQMDKFRKEKQEFLSTVVPQWEKKAKERQGKMGY
jgi:nitrite reductase (cytochrome c-552)